MLPELFLLLSGHPSALFVYDSPTTPRTLVLSQQYSTLFHPGEESSLNHLGQLAFHFSKVRLWAEKILSEARNGIRKRVTNLNAPGGEREVKIYPSQYLSSLSSALLLILDEYLALVVETEKAILNSSASTSARSSTAFVPLSTLVATFDQWRTPMASFSHLVDTLTEGPPSSSSAQLSTPIPNWPPGLLIDLLHLLSQTGHSVLAQHYETLSRAVQKTWSNHLLIFLLHGLTPSSTPLENVATINTETRNPVYELKKTHFPSFISAETRGSILYIGRAVATIKSQGKGKEMPLDMMRDLAGHLDGILPESKWEFGPAVERIRAEVGEWLWQNILTAPMVSACLASFASFFLLRNGEFSSSLLREIERLKLSKLQSLKPTASNVIREQDLNFAILRSSVGTTAEKMDEIESLRFKMEKGPLRPLLPSLSNPSTRGAKGSVPPNLHVPTSGTTAPPRLSLGIFSSHLLGTPTVLTSVIEWPLDLIVTEEALVGYSNCFAFLSAIKKTHIRVRDCWLSLSGAQRSRRRWTGVGEGGLDSEEEATGRKRLARLGWGVVREMIWFLESINCHFHQDVIEVHYKDLLAKLENVAPPATATSTGNVASLKTPRSLDTPRPGSPSSFHLKSSSQPPPKSLAAKQMAASASRSQFSPTASAAMMSRGPTNLTEQPTYLDFMTLRSMHTNYLTVIEDGLLLSDMNTATTIKDILDICERFVGLVERWGGDVLPDLLVEGTGGEKTGQLVRERGEIVEEIQTTLSTLINEFFHQLAPAAATPANPADPLTSVALNANTSISMSLRAGASLRPLASLGTKGRGEKEKERERDSEAIARKHLESLGARLDFGGWFSKVNEEEDEEEQEGEGEEY